MDETRSTARGRATVSSEGSAAAPKPVYSSADERHLKGWKQIGNYLGVCDRSVQRWELTLGLPIHRIPTEKSAIVFAVPRELDAWARSREGQQARAGETPPGVGTAGLDDNEDPLGETDQDWELQTASAAKRGVANVVPPPMERLIRRRVPRYLRTSHRVLFLGLAALFLALLALWLKPQRAPLPQAGANDMAPPKTELPAESAPPNQAFTLRVICADGMAFQLGIVSGRTATLTVGDGTDRRGLSLERVGENARLHVYDVRQVQPHGVDSLVELAVALLRQGVKTELPSTTGLASVEWLQVRTPSSSSQGGTRGVVSAPAALHDRHSSGR